jgi:hypothetical protein
MKLELGLDVLRSYKRLPYTAWHALGEFVDNSTQSYFDNRETLDKAFAESGDSLEVRITYDKEDTGLLRIADNAMGMNYAELTHALHVGLPPDDPTGRSRYGLGMKMAACWFGNRWRIVTKKLGETTEYTVELDVEAIANGDADLAESMVTDLPESDHYTRLEIWDLNRRPQGRTLGKIKEFLAGMYRLDVERGDLYLEWQGTPIVWEMTFDFLKDSAGAEYKKSFEFEVDGKRAFGWVGVLDTGGRPKAGFAVVHQGRMIQTWPESWHPTTIYGQIAGSNDLVNQRLVGEIHLDDFEVSHTKDDIHWLDNEQDDVEDKLREIVAEYRDVAKRTKKSRRLADAAIQAAARALEGELQSGELADLIDSDLPEPEAIEADDNALLQETDTSQTDFGASFKFRDRVVRIQGILDSTKSAHDPYVISEVAADDHVLVVINMNHPHVATIDENGLLNYFKHCTYDALAEWRASAQAAALDPGTVKRLKDGFLRLSFEIQMHEED